MNIDKSFVISVKEAEDRRKQFLESNDLDVEMFIVNRNSDPTKGNYESHKAVIETGKKRKYKTILVFEDDSVPLIDTKKIINYVNKFLENPPKDWKILSLGYLPISLKSTDNDSLFKINCAYDAHAYLVNLDNVDITPYNGVAFDSYLFCQDIDPRFIIKSLSNNPSEGIYAHYPMLYRQKAKKSYIAGVDLFQKYFFNIFGYNTSAKLSSYVNILYIIFLIIVLFFILLSVGVYFMVKNKRFFGAP